MAVSFVYSENISLARDRSFFSGLSFGLVWVLTDKCEHKIYIVLAVCDNGTY